MDFYDKLLAFKKEYKLNNQELGKHISMSGDAFRMAVNRRSLSQLEIHALENLFANPNIKEGFLKRYVKEIKDFVSEIDKNTVAEEKPVYKSASNSFYYPDISASAGLDTAFINSEIEKIPVSIPHFEKGIDFINVYGDSMYPKYCSGEIIGIKEIRPEYLNFGYAYVVILGDGEVYLKYIHKGKDNDHWVLSSENAKYDPREFHISLIKKIYIIKGVITKTTM